MITLAFKALRKKKEEVPIEVEIVDEEGTNVDQNLIDRVNELLDSAAIGYTCNDMGCECRKAKQEQRNIL